MKAYLTVNPADYSQGGGVVYVGVRTTDGYTSTWSMPGIVISPAQMPVITQDVSTGVATGPTVSLSSSAETANCYVVSTPSQRYSFDATVAGNGGITDDLLAAVQRFGGRPPAARTPGGV